MNNDDWRRIREISLKNPDYPILLENDTYIGRYDVITKLDVNSVDGSYIKGSGERRKVEHFDLVIGRDKTIKVNDLI
jgi:hypothetical protein